MPTPYKTAEQKYLFETYADDVGCISQATVRRIADLLSDTVWVRPENRRDFAASATHAEKTFLAHLIEAGVRAVLDGGDFYSVSSALEYMFVSWDHDNKEKRHLDSYMTFYCPFARLCGKGQKVEL